MRFPLKLALSAVLANGIAAELTHMAQTQQLPNEVDVKLQGQQIYRQAVNPVSKLRYFCKCIQVLQ